MAQVGRLVAASRGNVIGRSPFHQWNYSRRWRRANRLLDARSLRWTSFMNGEMRSSPSKNIVEEEEAGEGKEDRIIGSGPLAASSFFTGTSVTRLFHSTEQLSFAKVIPSASASSVVNTPLPRNEFHLTEFFLSRPAVSTSFIHPPILEKLKKNRC